MANVPQPPRVFDIPTLSKKEKEEERRAGGPPVSFLGRTTGITLEAGGGTLGAGSAAGGAAGASPLGSAFSSFAWGLRGRAGLLSVLRSAAARYFTPGELALLSVGALSVGVLCVLGISSLVNSTNDGSRMLGWRPEKPADDGFSAAGGVPQEPARPGIKDLMSGSMLKEAEPAETPETKPAEPKKDAPAEPTPPPTPPGLDAPPEAGREVWGGTLLARSPSLFDAKASRGGGAMMRDALAPLNGTQSGGAAVLGGAAGGNLSDPARRPPPRPVGSYLTSSARSPRAMGQLKFANKTSNAARGFSAGDPARQYATNAFEQGRTTGGSGVLGATGSEVLGPLGSGAPDLTQRDVGPGENKTPYQKQADQAKKDNNMAMLLTMLGGLLLAIGGMLAKMGHSMMSNPATMPQGKQLMAMGIALMAAGAAAIIAGLVMSQQGKGGGKKIADQYGQKDQGRVIDSCANQAVMPQHCRAPSVNIPGNSVHQDVAATSNARYEDESHPIMR